MTVIPDEVPRSLESVVILTTLQVMVAVPYAPVLVSVRLSKLPKPSSSGSNAVRLDWENEM